MNTQVNSLKNKNYALKDGILPAYVPFFCLDEASRFNGITVVVTARDERVYTLTEQLKHVASHVNVLAFPAWDCLPYDRVSPSPHVTHTRLNTLYSLLNQDALTVIVTSISGLGQYVPPTTVLAGQNFSLGMGQSMPRSQLLDAFIARGCQRVETVYEMGEFAVRGSLIDVFAPGADAPVRLDFFGDTLESMKPFDPLTQKTLSASGSNNLTLRAAHEVLLTQDHVTRFRTAYRTLFGANKNFPADDPLYQSISDNRIHPGMEHWLPLFYEEKATLLDYIQHEKKCALIFEDGFETALHNRLEAIDDYYKIRLNPPFGDMVSYNPLAPNHLYWQAAEWENLYKNYPIAQVTSFKAQEDSVGIKILPSFKAARDQSPKALFQAIAGFLNDRSNKNRLIVCSSEGARDRLLHLIDDHADDFAKMPIVPIDTFPLDAVQGSAKYPEVLVTIAPLESGFETSVAVVLTEFDILGEHIRRAKPRIKKTDAFFQEMSQLAIDDLIVHRDHGIGRYMGLLTVTVDASPHDCLVLTYDGGDKLFLPVENIELLSRYGDADSLASLDRLGSNAWQNRKARVKKRIQIVADYLIQLAAERSLKKAVSLEQTSHLFDDFCGRFPFVETDDQLRAIEDVLQDIASGKPMDRLICGDVGFGKTEVALRAAFIAAMNSKQVAIVVPTTLLCRQHFATFQKRFQGFPFKIAQLSRLVSAKNAKLTHEEIEAGTVDIVIGTHALLSQQTKFHDLGLVIVDEEQHFGVKQKEKLKQLRADVHVLTLTATPIPRTLQLSLSGVRDLSLITTPPVDRLAVRTFVMPKDPMIIREAIMREFNRGGQTFYVTPRLEDLPKLLDEIKALVPEVKIGIAHGQLSATELEDVMTAFYDRQYDVLLSTNIVESGIDVPTANTLIIHKCDLFGLSQLYQLRGRVGRAKTQGYAYLTYPPTQNLSVNATKRLHVLQSLDTLGAGFTLASHDLDIRGAGNIVGEEQSGHIREVGVELYQTLLHEAIMMTQAKNANDSEGQQSHDWTPQINLGVAVLIPDRYVSDLGLRLNLYRRVANLENRADIDAFAAELIDRFGKLPPEVRNLLDVVELKSLCRKAHIEKLDAGPKGLLVTFYENTPKDQGKLIAYLQKPEVAKVWAIKIRPDQKLFFGREFHDPEVRRKGTLQLVKDLVGL